MMRRKSTLINSLLVIVGLLVVSTANAVNTGSGEIHYLNFQGTNITVAIKAANQAQIVADPDSCGENDRFVLLATHTNYDALAGALLTYYYDGRSDVNFNLVGCDGTFPTIDQVSAGQ